MKSPSSMKMNVVRESICILFFSLVSVASASAQTMPILGHVSVPFHDSLALNPALNLIYQSDGFSTSSSLPLTVIDGSSCPITANAPCTYSVLATVNGSGTSVDLKNDNYWAGYGYPGSVAIYSGSSNTQIGTVTTGYCPDEVVFNGKSRVMWVGAQCGGGNDPVFAVDADTFAIIKGPIGSGGVMSTIAVNPVTGRLYVLAGTGGVYTSEEVNPKTYAVTPTSFGGTVAAINPISNLLYAVSGTNLQIIYGSSEKILHTVALGYYPSFVVDNNALHHLYVGNPTTNSIEVRSDATGEPINKPPMPWSFPLPSGAAFANAAAVDSVRGRLYLTLSVSGSFYVYGFEDLSAARNCLTSGASCGVGIGIR